ncbi:MAG TPA: hypothetical protein VMW17_09880 [Candidatus Binatia bacterium]|nr:hypothetical protein [Candidatus Binatia bacterium]
MRRQGFLPGLIVGLAIGLAAGLVVALQFESSTGDAARVQDLTARLDRAERDKAALNRQLDEFRVTAERMTKSFSDLERRFKALEDDVHHGEVPTIAAAPSQTPGNDSTP